MSARRRLGIGVVGFGWMGQAHSRSAARIASLFPERIFDTELVMCADNVPASRDKAVDGFGFREATDDWSAVVEHPDVDVVYVTAPNMMHEPVAVAAAEAGKAVFCEKPVGGTPAQTVADRRCRAAGRRDHRCRLQLPLGAARAVRQAVDRHRPVRRHHELLRPVLLDVRRRPDGAAVLAVPRRRGRPRRVSTDILSHSVDLGTTWSGRSPRSSHGETFIKERPLANRAVARTTTVASRAIPPARSPTRTTRARCGLRTAPVARSRRHARWSAPRVRTASRSTARRAPRVEPRDDERAAGVHRRRARAGPAGYTTVYAATVFRTWTLRSGRRQLHRLRRPQSDRELRVPVAVARDEQHEPGFSEAIDYVGFRGPRGCVRATRAPGETCSRSGA